MDGEDVHDRLRAPARPVGEAHVADERGRGLRVAWRIRVVRSARRERPSKHPDPRGDSLQAVVRPRQEADIRRRRDVLAELVELRLPEPVQVRLVPDDEIPHRRQVARECRGERDELPRLLLGERDIAGPFCEDREEDPDPVASSRGRDIPKNG